jgi:hypothetical protein
MLTRLLLHLEASASPEANIKLPPEREADHERLAVLKEGVK